jgi:sec-independent protein translocase protein TatC
LSSRPDDDWDEVEQHRMPLLDHLRELRNRLLIAAAGLGVGLVVSLAFVSEILAVLTAPMTAALTDPELGIQGSLSIVNSPFEGISVWLNVALIGGAVLASPVITYQLWAFIAPGLYQTERRLVVPLAASSTFLFLAGGAFAYFWMIPYVLQYGLRVVDAEVNLSIQGYLSAVMKMLLAFGACFQLPIGTFFASRMGLIDHRDMIRGFRYSFVGIFVIAAVITPPDPLSQLVVALPLTVLYALSIGVAFAFSTKVRD